MITRFSPKQMAILKALAHYKFLTYSQMIELGIEQYKPNLSKLLSNLRESSMPMVKKIPHGMGEEVKHYLTDKALPILQEMCGLEIENIHYPKGTILTNTQDETHRTRIIDFQISLDLACNQEGIQMLFCDRYFDKVGNNKIEKNLKSKTAFEYKQGLSIKPDMVFMLKTFSKNELYLVELENGKDSKKSIEKCLNHGAAIYSGSVNQKFGYKSGYRTLWIFEHEPLIDIVIEKLEKESTLQNLKEYFLFKPISKMKENPFLNWRNLSGIERKLFY